MSHPGARFLGVFLFLAALFYAFTLSDVYLEYLFPPIVESQAVLSGGLLNALGYGVDITGAEVRSDLFALRIAEGCDAVEAMALYGAACLAFPAPWLHRARGVSFGLLAIYALNVMRVVTLFITGVHAYAWFHTLHVDLWPTIILVEAVLFWLWWSRSARPRTSAATARA